MIYKLFDDFKLNQAKNLINLNDYISKQLSARSIGVYECPFQAHEHDNVSPGLKVKDNRVTCFKCGFQPLDIVGWLEKYERLTTFEAIKKTLSLAGIEDATLDAPITTNKFPDIKFGQFAINIVSIYIASLSFSKRKIADLLHIKLDKLPNNIGVIDSNNKLIPFYLRAEKRFFLVIPTMESVSNPVICGISLRFLIENSAGRLVRDLYHDPKWLKIGAQGIWFPLIDGVEVSPMRYQEVEGISDVPPFVNKGDYNVKVMMGVGQFSAHEVLAPDLDKAGIAAALSACKGFIAIGNKRELRDSSYTLQLFIGALKPLEILPSIYLFCKDVHVIDTLFKAMLVAARINEDCYCALATLADRADVSITGFAQQKIDFQQHNGMDVDDVLLTIHNQFDKLEERYQHFVQYPNEYVAKICSSMRMTEFKTNDHHTYLFKKQIIQDLAATIPNGYDDYLEPTLLKLSELHDAVPSGSIVLLGGDTGTKKTSITLRIIADLSVNYKVAFFSLEEKLFYMKQRLELYEHAVLDNVSLTPNLAHAEFIALYAAIEAKKGAKFIVIDHANFLKDESLLENAMHKLNEVAKRFDVVILIVAQMLKNIDMHKTPILGYEQLYGGGAIKTYAHFIFIVQKYKITYNQMTKQNETIEASYIANCKNRYGLPLSNLNYFTRDNKLIDFRKR